MHQHFPFIKKYENLSQNLHIMSVDLRVNESNGVKLSECMIFTCNFTFICMNF